ncbi:MAG: AtpZ/AtpI family protein [Gammaproteobacteria bacterium]
MNEGRESFERADMRESTLRDLDRRRRRRSGPRFWSSLSLIGSVGWPIVLLATGGALLGRYLDARWATGVRFTLLLLTIGTLAGTVIAFRVLRGDER